MDLNNAAAIVTGGASGLGEATARMLAARGAKVAIFDLNEELGEKIASELGGKFFKVDVANEENVIASVAAAQEAHGIARVLVNCAGVGTPTKVIDRDNNPLPLAQFTKVVNINLVGSFNVLTHFAAGLVHAEPGEDGARGVIINTASVAAYDGQIGQAAYSASKGGIVGMTLPIAPRICASWHPGNDHCPRHFLDAIAGRLATSCSGFASDTSAIPKPIGPAIRIRSTV